MVEITAEIVRYLRRNKGTINNAKVPTWIIPYVDKKLRTAGTECCYEEISKFLRFLRKMHAPERKESLDFTVEIAEYIIEVIAL